MSCTSFVHRCFFFLSIRRPPRSTRTDTLFPYTTLFRSRPERVKLARQGGVIAHRQCPCRQSFPIQVLSLERAEFDVARRVDGWLGSRSEEHTSELQSLMSTSYAVFGLKQKRKGAAQTK